MQKFSSCYIDRCIQLRCHGCSLVRSTLSQPLMASVHSSDGCHYEMYHHRKWKKFRRNVFPAAAAASCWHPGYVHTSKMIGLLGGLLHGAGDLLHEDRRGGGQSGILLGEDLSRRARVVVSRSHQCLFKPPGSIFKWLPPLLLSRNKPDCH